MSTNNKADLIRFSERFYSPQGEGLRSGFPTLWLRYFTCSLQCDGFGQKDPTDPSTYELPYKDFDLSNIERLEDLPVWDKGCDSSYSWSSKYKHLQHREPVEQVVDGLFDLLKNEFNPNGLFEHPHSGAGVDLCFTGGEPLMPINQKYTVQILTEMAERGNCPRNITFETNGTQALTDELAKLLNDLAIDVLFSVSPKLWTVAGEKREKAIKPALVRDYLFKVMYSDIQLKYVLGPIQRQWDELEEVRALFMEHGVFAPTLIMPIGATEEGQNAVAADVANMTRDRGYIVCGRYHVHLFGNVIGV